MTTSSEPSAGKNQNIWLLIPAGLIGLFCCGLFCLGALSLYGLFAVNNQYATVIAPRLATQVAFYDQATATQVAAETQAVNAVATAVAAEHGFEVLTSQFDDNTDDWPVGIDTDDEYGTLNRRIVDGKYSWTLDATKGVVWYGYPYIKGVRDFYTSVEASPASEATDFRVGLIFRRYSADGYYYFHISPSDQYFAVELWYRDGWKIMVPPTYTDAIQPDGNNKYAVLGTGSRFVLFINDTYVAEFEDDTLRSGLVGIAIGGGETSGKIVVEYDNFLLRDPAATANSTPTPILPASAMVGTAAAELADIYLAYPPSFEEDFTGNINNWPTGSATLEFGEVNRLLQAGQYQWTINTSKQDLVYAWPDLDKQTDFYFAADVQQTGGSNDDNYGIIFRSQGSDSFYFFGINNWKVGTVYLQQNGKHKMLLQRSLLDSIKPGGINRLAIVAETSHFTFYVNDVYIDELEDATFPNGNIGLGVEIRYQDEGVDFNFDNLEVRSRP